MGIDIFCCVERQVVETWVYYGPPLVETHRSLHVLDPSLRDSYSGSVVEGDEEQRRALAAWNKRFGLGRNYSLFAILADVRNDRGRFKSISKPRGIPSDVSAETRWSIVRNLGYEDDAHDHSWVTVAELISYDWGQHVSLDGFVTASEYLSYKQTGAPRSWAVRPPIARAKVVSEEEMEEAVRCGGDATEILSHVVWQSTCRSCVGEDFFSTTLPALRAVGEPASVRLVFFFSS